MAHLSDPRFLVLHALRLRGFADLEPVVVTTGLTEADVADLLDQLGGEGLVHLREGRVHGWSLTASGRELHLKGVDAELDEAACRSAIDAGYRDFLGLNREMLAVCTDWQLKDGGLNEHHDTAYDAAVIARLRALDDRVQPICLALAETLDRFSRYGGRLNAAVVNVEAGDTEWFTKPLIDSYHTVWFELHEDLLATLGIERSKEEA